MRVIDVLTAAAVFACLANVVSSVAPTPAPTTEVEEESSPEQIAELKDLVAKKAELTEKLAAMKSKIRNDEIDQLKELKDMLEGMEEGDKGGQKGAAMSDDLVEKLLSGLNAKRAKEEADLNVPLVEDELYACALLSARHYTNPMLAGSADKAKDARGLINSFAGGKDKFDLGVAVESSLFRAVAACVSKLGKAGLVEFKDAGGFAMDSTRSLSKDIAQEAEHAKTATMWTGEVFKISFDKPRWSLLQRAFTKHYPEVDGAKSEL